MASDKNAKPESNLSHSHINGSEETNFGSSFSENNASDETRSTVGKSIILGSDETRSLASHLQIRGSDETSSTASFSVRSYSSFSQAIGSDDEKSTTPNAFTDGSDKTRSPASYLQIYGSDETSTLASLSLRSNISLSHIHGSDEAWSEASFDLSSDDIRSPIHGIDATGLENAHPLRHASATSIRPRRAHCVVGSTKREEHTKTNERIDNNKSAHSVNIGDGEVGEKNVNITEKGGYEVGERCAYIANKVADEVEGQLKTQSKYGKYGEVLGSWTKPKNLYSVTGGRCINVRIRSDRSTCCICDMCQIPDGRLLMTDYSNDSIKLLDQSYNVIDHCEIPDKPTLVCWCGEEACVGQYSSRTLQFVSIHKNMKISRTMKLNYFCTGLAYCDGELYVSDCYANLHVYNMTGNQLRVYNIGIIEDGGWIIDHLTVSFDGRLLYMIRGDYVICVDRQTGKAISRVNGENDEGYRGIGVDKDNNGIVCDYSRGELVHYSSY